MSIANKSRRPVLESSSLAIHVYHPPSQNEPRARAISSRPGEQRLCGGRVVGSGIISGSWFPSSSRLMKDLCGLLRPRCLYSSSVLLLMSISIFMSTSSFVPIDLPHTRKSGDPKSIKRRRVSRQNNHTLNVRQRLSLPTIREIGRDHRPAGPICRLHQNERVDL
ncbi:hypothetical protein K474DRAFT_1505709 [Panus rudis PR-1116 ss-1]|nr:hypothetical protein K474DRAFT_1505709 [Panus rudis PR-1116 ss-1]